jgi:Tfp pilus assembly protein PilO
MKNLSKSEKLLLSLMVVVVTLYAYFTFFLSPKLEAIAIVNEAITKVEDDINANKVAEINNKKQKETLAELKKKKDEYKNIVPTSERQPEISNTIKRVSDNNRVNLISVNFGKGSIAEAVKQGNQQNSNTVTNEKAAAEKKDITLMTSVVTIVINGEYQSILSFAKELEENSRITEITSLNIAGSGTAISNNMLQGNITVSFYYIDGNLGDEETYDFNKGSYGKDNLFK